jgi:hypothetical protein
MGRRAELQSCAAFIASAFVKLAIAPRPFVFEEVKRIVDALERAGGAIGKAHIKWGAEINFSQHLNPPFKCEPGTFDMDSDFRDSRSSAAKISKQQSRRLREADCSMHGAASMGCNRRVAAHRLMIQHLGKGGQRSSSVGDGGAAPASGELRIKGRGCHEGATGKGQPDNAANGWRETSRL